MPLVHHKQQKRHSILQVRKNARWADRMTIERGSQVIKALTQLRIVEQNRRGNRRGSSPSQLRWATMRGHCRRCVRKGSRRSRKSIWSEHLPRRLCRSLGNTALSEQLGQDASYDQPHWLREKIHTGRLTITQADGHALPMK